MAHWISSKLKAAENILQQIDQQAADSLRKNERPHADEEPGSGGSPVRSGGVVPLKDQLKKKSQENSDYNGKLRADPNFGLHRDKDEDKGKDVAVGLSKPIVKPKTTLTDSDWTQLLSAPNKSPGSGVSGGYGGVGIRSLSKNGRKQGGLSSVSKVSEIKKNQKGGSSGLKVGSKHGGLKEVKLGRKGSEGEDSSSSTSGERHSIVESKSGGMVGQAVDGKSVDANANANAKAVEDLKGIENGGTGKQFDHKDGSLEKSLEQVNNDHPRETADSKRVDVMPDAKSGTNVVRDHFRSGAKGKDMMKTTSRASVSDDLKAVSSLTSDESSGSDSDSGSSSTSESEREREERRRREKILAERAAARAQEAIKERENKVARLEGEKQSLEKILEERAKQQVQEASDLQTTMMETMDAVDLEKQKHNSTRMEALARIAKLETANTELARSLAMMQRNLDAEVKHMAELRQLIELKEVASEELKRRISSSNQTEPSKNQVAALKGAELEREVLEAEYSLINDEVSQLQEKARNLEANIEITRKDIEDPTDVEVELKRRLSQMTDHLIQKQAQVESLSSEKASLTFRIEAVSRLIDESSSSSTTDLSASSRDIESGSWDLSNSKLKPLIKDKIHLGRERLGSLLRQLDSIFLAGAVFLRRNPRAKLWSVLYAFCLHVWVIYILMSHTRVSHEAKSGAVFSLENINTTAA